MILYCDICGIDMTGIEAIELEDSIVCNDCYDNGIPYCPYCECIPDHIDYVLCMVNDNTVYKAVHNVCNYLINLKKHGTMILGEDIVM